MLTLHVNGAKVALDIGKFPAGETRLRIVDDRPSVPVRHALITCEFHGNDDLINLGLLADAVRRHYEADGRFPPIHLTIPYLPYARQDRVCRQGEPLSIKVIANFINSLRFQSVHCWDAHSDVALALFNNLTHLPAASFASAFALKPCVIVAPDAGAVRRAVQFAQFAGMSRVVTAVKNRDPDGGAISGTAVDCGHVGDADFLIVDDICDGGTTFTRLACQLRQLTTGKIYLYVTHGIFSKGIEPFIGLIDGIYTANLMADFTHPLIQKV